MKPENVGPVVTLSSRCVSGWPFVQDGGAWDESAGKLCSKENLPGQRDDAENGKGTATLV